DSALVHPDRGALPHGTKGADPALVVEQRQPPLHRDDRATGGAGADHRGDGTDVGAGHLPRSGEVEHVTGEHVDARAAAPAGPPAGPLAVVGDRVGQAFGAHGHEPSQPRSSSSEISWVSSTAASISTRRAETDSTLKPKGMPRYRQKPAS